MTYEAYKAGYEAGMEKIAKARWRIEAGVGGPAHSPKYGDWLMTQADIDHGNMMQTLRRKPTAVKAQDFNNVSRDYRNLLKFNPDPSDLRMSKIRRQLGMSDNIPEYNAGKAALKEKLLALRAARQIEF